MTRHYGAAFELTRSRWAERRARRQAGEGWRAMFQRHYAYRGRIDIDETDANRLANRAVSVVRGQKRFDASRGEAQEG